MGAGGMNRGTRKFGVAGIYVRVDGQIFVIWTRRASRNVQFPFFSFFLFFLDTCPILNFFQENSSILGNFWRRYLCYRVIEIEFMFV